MSFHKQEFHQRASWKGLEAQVGYLVSQINEIFPNNKIKLGLEDQSGFINLVQVSEHEHTRLVSADSKRDMQNILTALQNFTNLLYQLKIK